MPSGLAALVLTGLKYIHQWLLYLVHFNFYSGPIYNCTIFQAAVCNPVSCDDHFGLSELSPECGCVLREVHRTQKSYVGVCEGSVEEV